MNLIDHFLSLQIPTTVFTPLEYSTVGFSESEALSKLGEDNIEVFQKLI
jgi:thioredoxin reductase (NADPH)